jgi:hypothetical protein
MTGHSPYSNLRPKQKEGGNAEALPPKGEHMSNVDVLVPNGNARSRINPKEVRDLEIARLEKWVADKINEAHNEPITELVTLSPALASILLSRNEKNRPVSQVGLERIKRDLEQGRWVFNGESLIVSIDGKLNDGQHRCRAVIETGISIRMVIVFGPRRESRMTLDQGVTRTVGHYLGMSGHTDANTLGTVANYYWQHKTRGYLSGYGPLRPTKAQAVDVVDSNPLLTDSIAYVSRKGAASLTTKPMLAFCHRVFAEASHVEHANKFMDLLLSGAYLANRDPILYCRNRLIETRSRTNIQERAELLFKTWNAWRKGEKVDRIMIGGRSLPELMD